MNSIAGIAGQISTSQRKANTSVVVRSGDTVVVGGLQIESHDDSRSKFPFNMGWWGFTFPLGVFTVSTTTIGKEMPSKFFEVLGTVCLFSIAQPLMQVMDVCAIYPHIQAGDFQM